jgi:hypothetical protein
MLECGRHDVLLKVLSYNLIYLLWSRCRMKMLGKVRELVTWDQEKKLKCSTQRLSRESELGIR